MKPNTNFILLCTLFVSVSAWDSEELEIFDLVEEINVNFYDFLEISQNATSKEIKRAFRGLSIVLHPDKNPADDANIQFRNLVSIYEVLKDTTKRQKYDKILKNGLPNWKSALFYYRRMRKIGLYEGALILFIITTIGQYIFAWAAYMEKKYTAEQVFGTKLKKLQKKNKIINMAVILNEIPPPSIINTLPFQIPLAVWNLPKTIRNAFSKANELKDIAMERRRLELEAAKRHEELEKELEEQARLRREKKENLRKRKQNSKAPEKNDDDLLGYSKIHIREFAEDGAVKPVFHKTNPVTGGFWADEDLTELIRLVKKYPGGSSSRWNTIAEAMNRTVQEVTFMAGKMKENGYKISNQSDCLVKNNVQQKQELIKKQKVKKTSSKNILVPETNWSQDQQRALECAIVKYRKTDTDDRWQKIGNCVPDKSKEECLVRYKYLCELVKSQKRAEQVAIDIKEEIECTDIPKDLFEHKPTETALMDEGSSQLLEKVSNKLSKREARRQRNDPSSSED